MSPLPFALMIVGVLLLLSIGFKTPAVLQLFNARFVRSNLDAVRKDGVAQRQRLLLRAGISIIILASASYVLFSGVAAAPEVSWAFGAVGVLIGFWFKGA
jgi:hypothetical protein